ncbi:MAG: T9SS type A sorting domain-containing protein, partial [Bacteroidota bacterium]
INYSTIYHYPGVCGNTSTDENVSYLHTNPYFNANNYYKIELVPIEMSFAKKIFVPEIPIVNAIIYPNPIVTNADQLKFRILSANNTKLTGYIYNHAGIPISTLELTTVFDIATINVNEFKNDTYLIKLSDSEKTYSFKFIINR